MKKILLIMLIVVFVATGKSIATTYYVNADCGNDSWNGTDPNCQEPNGPKQTIQAAVDAAGNNDTIMVADGTYIGPGNRGIDLFGITLTLVSENGSSACIINCQGQDNAFQFGQLGYAGKIDGFTIINGNWSNGGAVFCGNQSEPIITNCVFTNNESGEGGAIFCGNNTRPTISYCTFNNNSAVSSGGAICFGEDSSPTVNNCDFSGNEAQYGGSIYCDRIGGTIKECIINNCSYCEIGGGIYCEHYSSPIIRDCIINNNVGGGISCDMYSSPLITDCTINNNSGANLGQYGGGIYCNNHSSPNVINCVINGNTGSMGGGVTCRNASNITMTNCELSGNKAVGSGPIPDGPGGGLFSSDSSPMIINCTINGNWAERGGGITCEVLGGTPVLVLENCTLNGNRAEMQGGGLCIQTSAAITNSIVWGNTASSNAQIDGSPTVTYCDVNDGFPGTGNIDEDPKFFAPGYWDDGGTQGLPEDDIWVGGDHHLMSRAGRWNPVTEDWELDIVTSPCIDAGDPLSPVSDEPVPNGERINIGAYGGTEEASKSSFCVMAIDGDVNKDCKVDFVDFAIMASNWLECNLVPQSDCWN